jgi:hypothetical protein
LLRLTIAAVARNNLSVFVGSILLPFLVYFSHCYKQMSIERSEYTAAIAKKRPWQAVAVSKGALRDGSEETILRALAIRHLELPVKTMLHEGLERDLPSTPGLIEAIESNILDEERHDEALNYVAAAHGVDEAAEREALRIRDAWLAHPAHPLAKVAVLERSLFFTILPFFRFNGDKGIRTVASDISRDEICHAFVHTKICDEMNETYGKSLNELRKMTALWIYDKLGPSEDKWLDKDFWLRQSDKLFYEGKAPELSSTRRSVMPSFFESNALNLPSYGAA